MNILITGASGLLGRAIYKTFKNIPEFDLFGTAFSRPSNDLIKIDLTDSVAVEKLIQDLKPDVIIHAAAERKPDVSQRDPQGTLKLNVKATEKLAELAKNHNAWLVYISTDYVFDGSTPPYLPNAAPNPLNFYGQSKLDGENAVRQINPDAAILRVPILYGPVDFLGEDAISVIAANLLKANEPVVLDNWATRYPTHVEDVALVLADMAKYRQSDTNLNGTFHWSGDEVFTKYTMGLIMAEMIGKPYSSLVNADRPTDATPRPKNCHLDITKLTNLGIKHNRPFKEAIEKVLARIINELPPKVQN